MQERVSRELLYSFSFHGALSRSHRTLIDVVLKSGSEHQFSRSSNYCPKSLADLKLPQDKALGDKELGVKEIELSKYLYSPLYNYSPPTKLV